MLSLQGGRKDFLGCRCACSFEEAKGITDRSGEVHECRRYKLSVKFKVLEMIPAYVVIALVEDVPHRLLLQALFLYKPNLLEFHLPKEALPSLARPRLLRVRLLCRDLMLKAELTIINAESRCHFVRGDEADVPLGWADPRDLLVEID